MTVLLSDGCKSLSDTMHRILDAFAADIDPVRGVFIKPNIVFAAGPGSGEITPPGIVRTLVAAMRQRYGNIDIILGEGVAAGCDAQENFRISGYAELAHGLNVPLLDLDRADRRTMAWKFGKLALPCVALDRTYINLPILKPSSACIISGALKNQKGLLLPAVKKHFHRLGLQEPIAELNRVVRPSLTIMDGSYFFGRDVLVAGNNCGEIDATACNLLGIDEPEHVQLARSMGVFAEGYAVTGDTIHMRRTSARPTAREYRRVGRLRLWSNPQACTMCRRLFGDVQHDLLKPENLLAGVKLLALSVEGAEIIMGLQPQWRREYRTVICVGDCTRRVAQEGGYLYIPGCPPTASDFYQNLG